MPGHARVRSTIHRFVKTSKALRSRFMISNGLGLFSRATGPRYPPSAQIFSMKGKRRTRTVRCSRCSATFPRNTGSTRARPTPPGAPSPPRARGPSGPGLPQPGHRTDHGIRAVPVSGREMAPPRRFQTPRRDHRRRQIQGRRKADPTRRLKYPSPTFHNSSC